MICGIDEAGRGPLAGPVCAAAVILPADFPAGIVNDSKKLNPARREEARRHICTKALAWGVGWASHSEIDEINILQASLLAMRRACEQVFHAAPEGRAPHNDEPFWQSIVTETPFGSPLSPEELPADLCAIVDGLFIPDIPIPCTAMVKADAQVPEVMAASILAKTARDQLMQYYGALYPAYGYEQHKGYPTAEHRKRLAQFGPSPIQRMSFRTNKR